VDIETGGFGEGDVQDNIWQRVDVVSNVSRGHDYEREVKQHFVDAGWNCIRAAHSASGGPHKIDLVAYVKKPTVHDPLYIIIHMNGYTFKASKSTKIQLRHLASKIEKKYYKHFYWELVIDEKWIICLMQCKTGKR